MLVCEDAWHSLTGTVAALDGAQVIFLSSAAPARGVEPRDDGISGPATVARWERLIRDIAEEHGVFVSYVNLVGSEGGKAFWGASAVAAPSGDVQARAPLFEEALLPVTIDLGDVARVRADVPLLADLRTALPGLQGALARLGQPTEAAAYDADAPAGWSGPQASCDPEAARRASRSMRRWSSSGWCSSFVMSSRGADSRALSSAYPAAWTRRSRPRWPPAHWARRT